MLTLINSSPINNSALPIVGTEGDYLFNDFSLHDLVNITLRKVDNDDLGPMDVPSYNLAYNHGGAVIDRYYRGRSIKFEGMVKAATADLFQAYMDLLKKSTSKLEGSLKVKERTINATLKKMYFNREGYNITASPIAMEFETVDPFWKEGTALTSYLGKTVTFSEEVSYVGSAPSSPIWYIIFGTGSATSQVKLTYGGLDFTIPGSFASGDLLVIDGVNKEVKKNGADIDFTGVFPEFSTYSNPFTVGFTGTTLADVNLAVDKNYL